MSIIVDSITGNPPRIPPGGVARIIIAAHSTLGQELLMAGPAVDQATGEQVPMTVSITLPQPVRFTPLQPARGTLLPVEGRPGEFLYTAEAAAIPPHQL